MSKKGSRFRCKRRTRIPNACFHANPSVAPGDPHSTPLHVPNLTSQSLPLASVPVHPCLDVQPCIRNPSVVPSAARVSSGACVSYSTAPATARALYSTIQYRIMATVQCILCISLRLTINCHSPAHPRSVPPFLSLFLMSRLVLTRQSRHNAQYVVLTHKPAGKKNPHNSPR